MTYATLKQYIAEHIQDNTTQAITGQVLQDTLLDMVNEMGVDLTDIVLAPVYAEGANILDPASIIPDKYVRSDNGDEFAGTDIACTSFIEIPPEGLICNHTMKNSGSVGCGGAVYDEDKNFVAMLTNSQYHGAPLSVNPAGHPTWKYVRFNLKDAPEGQGYAVFFGTTLPTPDYIPYVEPTYILNIPDGAVTEEKLADGAVTEEKLADGAALDSFTEETVYQPFNRCNPDTTALGYIDKTTGAYVPMTSGNYAATDYMAVSQNGLYCPVVIAYGSLGGNAVYGADKEFLRGFTGNTYTYQAGDVYVRWGISLLFGYQVVVELDNGAIPTLPYPYPAYETPQVFDTAQGLTVSKDGVPELLPALSLAGDNRLVATQAVLAAESTLTLTGYPLYIHNSGFVSCFAKISTFSGCEVGFGQNDGVNGYFIQVTATELGIGKIINGVKTIFRTPVAHGITISGFVSLTITYNHTEFKARLTSLSGTFETTFIPDKVEKYGVPYVYTLTGTALTDVTLSGTTSDFKKPIWVIGDSYVSLYTARWTYQMIENYGIHTFLLDGLAGGHSNVLYEELLRLLVFGAPKFLVWCLGMNDDYPNYRYYLSRVERLCRTYGCELILQTIPWPTGDSKADINNLVKNSGHRYIDAYAAVSSDGSGTWYPGYTSDGVHPTEEGAQAIAAMVMTDFPEILE